MRYYSLTILPLSAAADLVYIRHPGCSPYQTSSFPHQTAHSGTVAGCRGDGGGWRTREDHRQSQRERGSNVMLNSNMQCSHHGNGGRSKAWCRECVFWMRVCLQVSVCDCMCKHVSVHLCKDEHMMQSKSQWRSSLAGEGGEYGSGWRTFRRSLKTKSPIFYHL